MPIKIKSSGAVEYWEMRGNARWRCVIPPGDTARADELLTADERAEVDAAWTPGVLREWQAQQAAIAEEFAPPENPLPSQADRLAAIEDALLSGDEADRQRVRDNVERVRGSTEQRG